MKKLIGPIILFVLSGVLHAGPFKFPGASSFTGGTVQSTTTFSQQVVLSSGSGTAPSLVFGSPSSTQGLYYNTSVNALAYPGLTGAPTSDLLDLYKSSWTWRGSGKITPWAGTDVALTLKQTSGQTADLQEWQNSSSVVLASVSASGIFSMPGQTVTGYAVHYSTLEVRGGSTNNLIQQATDYTISGTATMTGNGAERLIAMDNGVIKIANGQGGGNPDVLYYTVNQGTVAFLASSCALRLSTTAAQGGAGGIYARDGVLNGTDLWVVFNSTVTTGDLLALVDVAVSTNIFEVKIDTTGLSGMPSLGTPDATQGGFGGVVRIGHYLYCMGHAAVTGSFLVVVDISNRMRPLYVRVLPLPAYALHIWAAKDRLLVSGDVTGAGGFFQYSTLPDPSNPVFLSTAPTAGWMSEPESLAVDNGFLYGADWGGKKIWKTDISNPQKYYFQSATLPSGAYGSVDVYVAGNLVVVSAFISGSGGGYLFFYKADDLTYLGNTTYTPIPLSIVGKGRYLYVLRYNNTFDILQLGFADATAARIGNAEISHLVVRQDSEFVGPATFWTGLTTTGAGVVSQGPVSGTYYMAVSSAPTSALKCHYFGAMAALPTSGAFECDQVYNTTDHTLYIATEPVTAATSWKAAW